MKIYTFKTLKISKRTNDGWKPCIVVINSGDYRSRNFPPFTYGRQGNSPACSPLCAYVSFNEYSNYGQKKNCGRVLVPKSSRRSFWSRCLLDAEISSPVIRVAISATTFNRMNVANQDYQNSRFVTSSAMWRYVCGTRIHVHVHAYGQFRENRTWG